MTQAELAQIAGVTEATVSHVLNGRMASYTTIRKLARALTITPSLPGGDGIIGTQKAAARHRRAKREKPAPTYADDFVCPACGRRVRAPLCVDCAAAVMR